MACKLLYPRGSESGLLPTGSPNGAARVSKRSSDRVRRGAAASIERSVPYHSCPSPRVRVVSQNREGPVDLLREDNPRQLVRQGHFGERQQ